MNKIFTVRLEQLIPIISLATGKITVQAVPSILTFRIFPAKGDSVKAIAIIDKDKAVKVVIRTNKALLSCSSAVDVHGLLWMSDTISFTFTVG